MEKEYVTVFACGNSVHYGRGYAFTVLFTLQKGVLYGRILNRALKRGSKKLDENKTKTVYAFLEAGQAVEAYRVVRC
jgi:hypothetical protein